MPGKISPPINKYCWSNLSAFYKDFRQCPNIAPYGIKITPNDPAKKHSFLALMSISNGFGGSCNESFANGSMALFDAHITINNHAYVVTTARRTGTIAPSSNAGVHLDCYYWPRIFETGQKSVWAMFNVRHWADSDASFTTEMQILENIKFH